MVRERKVSTAAVISTADCDWNKATGTLSLSSRYTGGRFPRELRIESHHTGRIVTYTMIGVGHPKWDEDGWDGEMMLYETDADVAKLLYVRHD